MMRIALIGCGKAKAPKACAARDLYTGGLFKAALRYAEPRFDATFILSAKHHLVELDQKLEPYDRSLADLNVHALATWGDRVFGDLLRGWWHESKPPRSLEITILAGKAYALPIVGRVKQRAVAWPLEAPVTVRNPLSGLQMGQRLSWLVTQIDPADSRPTKGRRVLGWTDTDALDAAAAA